MPPHSLGLNMAAGPSEDHELLKTSHDLALWMIQLADAKADILVAASAILAGLLVPEATRTSNILAQGVLVLAVGLAILSAIMSLLTVFPRTTQEEHTSLLYFIAIMRFKSGEEYLSYLRQQRPGKSEREIAQQTWELANTQTKKYAYLRIGVVVFVMALLATFAGTLLAFLAAP